MMLLQQKLNQEYANLFHVSVQSPTIGQSTPYIELEIARFLLSQNRSVVSVFPTLYKAMKAYESMPMKEDILFFGADEFISAQLLSASPELLIQRIQTLTQLTISTDRPIWLITHIAAITKPVVNKAAFMQNSYHVKMGDRLERDSFLQLLVACGYERVPIVEKPGEIAVRGEIIDLFSPQQTQPVRLSFFDVEIDGIYLFDTKTQLRQTTEDSTLVVPMTDVLGNQLQSVINYFTTFTLVEHQQFRILQTYDHMYEDARQFMEHQSDDIPLFIPYEEVTSGSSNVISFGAFSHDHTLGAIDLDVQSKTNTEQFRKEVSTYLAKGYRCICLVGDADTVEADQKMMELFGPIDYVEYVADSGYNEVYVPWQIIVVDYESLLGHKTKQYQKNKGVFATLDIESNLKQADDIQIGDYVVHTQHGIGRYDGVQTIIVQDVEKDFLVLSYQADEKVYVPTEKITTLYKYIGKTEAIAPKLSKIGDKTWKNKTARVQEHIEAFAQELFGLYIDREKISGYAFPTDTSAQQDFEAAFPYPETKDQLLAIAEIKADMEKPLAMERILCGDVGFGKTEVAFRAAFKAMEAGKQVVMLAPTTILAKQHFENACKRFVAFGFKIKMLSRLVSKKEQEHTLFHTEVGEVNFLIGTHRLLSNDVIYADLGLVIIDEEHRFGVESKERLKRFQKNVDVLLISATPIPRTLQMAVTGIREMSLLETPPHNRYPVQTYVLEQNEHITRDAIERELTRNGQTYYLYNRVQTIETMTAKLQKMFPEASVRFAHGQMPKQQLEEIVGAFADKQIDILVSTTIIENGMDIPNANTLIIHEADRLGLAQLYQLRGRVGRSDRIAYSYFMYNGRNMLTQDAQKRLQTVQSFSEFGSGYHIAMRDLAIRGAGDILGKLQSGFINDVGFNLYIEMLQQAIQQHTAPVEEQPIPRSQKKDIDVSFTLAAYIPSSYIADELVKIELYQLIAKINTYNDLEQTQSLLQNRFGKLPDDVQHLLYLFLFRAMGQQYFVKYIRQVKNKVIIRFEKPFTFLIDRISLFKVMHDRGIEVKYVMEALELHLVIMRKKSLHWLAELYELIILAAEQRKQYISQNDQSRP